MSKKKSKKILEYPIKKFTINAYVDTDFMEMTRIEFSKEFDELDPLERADLMQDFQYLARLEYENAKDKFGNSCKAKTISS